MATGGGVPCLPPTNPPSHPSPRHAPPTACRYIDNTPAVQWTSNDPFGHWASAHYTQQVPANGYLCAAAYSSLAFDKYLGTTSAVDLGNVTLYETAAGAADKTYGWRAEPCSSTLGYICNFPISVFSNCSPPPSLPPRPPRPPKPPSPPVMPSCEQKQRP